MVSRVADFRLDSTIIEDPPEPAVAPGSLRVFGAILFDRRACPASVAAFKSALIHCPFVLHSAEVSGSFDFIVEAVFPDMSAYNDQLHCMAERLATLVARHETSFVGRRFIRTQHSDRAIWVPFDNGWKRLDCSAIDKVVAEGDYMLVHSGGTSWMVHSTLHALVDQLPVDCFVQISRSTVVRYGFIGSIRRTGRRWFALLDDGTQEPITRSRTVEILGTLRPASSKSQHSPSKHRQLTEVDLVS